jgi:hypothetical protein
LGTLALAFALPGCPPGGFVQPGLDPSVSVIQTGTLAPSAAAGGPYVVQVELDNPEWQVQTHLQAVFSSLANDLVQYRYASSQNLDGFRDDIPTLIVAKSCTCGLGPERGVAEIGGPAFCASLANADPMIASHELGHVFGLCDAYLPGSMGGCPGDGYVSNCKGPNHPYAVMCDDGSLTTPTPNECMQAKPAAHDYSLAYSWPR